MFKRQTLMFHFSTYRPNSLKHLYHYTPIRLHKRIDCCHHCIGRQNNAAIRFFIIDNNFSTIRKLLTPNMYCWSCKTLVTIHWTHLRLNGTCAMSFCIQKTNNRTLFLAGCTAISNDYKWTSRWRHRNKTHSWHSELNPLQNDYYGFFKF